MKYLVYLTLLVAIITMALGITPQAAEAADITCIGDLTVVAGPLVNPFPTNLYWIDGDGPGLPTAKQMVGTNKHLTFVVRGPGEWSNLTLRWERGGFGGVSMYPWAASCAIVLPGCDATLEMPSTAVGGTITDNAAVFQTPDPNAMTDIVLEVGKTFWMNMPDESGRYREVLVSCEWIWVEIEKTGPNYDDVWKGTPLPGRGTVAPEPQTIVQPAAPQSYILTDSGGSLIADEKQ